MVHKHITKQINLTHFSLALLTKKGQVICAVGRKIMGKTKPLSWMRVLGVTIFIVSPSMILAAYLWSELKEMLLTRYGIEIHPFFYSMGLIVVMWGAMWITGGRLIRDMNAYTEVLKKRRQNDAQQCASADAKKRRG